MIASLIRGRTHLTSKEFYNRNHFLFFTHILGLLDSLRPYIFDSITVGSRTRLSGGCMGTEGVHKGIQLDSVVRTVDSALSTE